MAPENASANLAASRNGAPAAARQPQEMRGVHALVKWESPADEVRGIAAGAAVLLRDHAVLPHQIGFAVPNRTWAVQLAQACKVMGVRASIVDADAKPSGSAAVIFDFRTPERNVEWLFVVGCTEGLMPTAAATGDDAQPNRISAPPSPASSPAIDPMWCSPISPRRTLPWPIRFACPIAARSPATASPSPA